MKFNSQMCTNIEQSKRLLSLGLKPETADMSWSNLSKAPVCHPYKKIKDLASDLDDKVYPAWSLHRLLEMCTIGMRVPSMRLYVKDVYDNVIGYIEELIRLKSFSKEYLEELCGKH